MTMAAGSGSRRRAPAALMALAVCAGCSVPISGGGAAPAPASGGGAAPGWIYQLQGYPDGRLDTLALAPQQIVVVDLARDAGASYFDRAEIAALRASGKTVLAYFEIGSIEDFRPEYPSLRRDAGDLIGNRWDDWPNEYFVRYWDERWWERVVAPRVDRALSAGFDGVYLDTPLAYEELDLAHAGGRSRQDLARAMADLVIRISRHVKLRRPGFLVVPQNSPELRTQAGYPEAIDGIGVEELFFEATDRRCTSDYCAENLEHTRALRDAGKLVLAVDYAARSGNVRAACDHYRTERFVGYVGPRGLDRIGTPCP